MNLHRVNREPDWEKVSPGERNIWQRLAARTRGVITPANAVSAAGTAAVLWGACDISRGKYVRGTIKIVAGRLCDLADGALAEKTGTKSQVGEAVDATGDKLQIAAVAAALAKRRIVPVPYLGIIGMQNAANAITTGVAKARGVSEFHPGEAGKYSVFAMWAGIGGLCATAAAREGGHARLASTFESVGDLAMGVYAGLGATATAEYVQAALVPVPAPVPPAALTAE
jgi:phosphatidylglycerophosphate synthase